jgi:hypothetical protein
VGAVVRLTGRHLSRAVNGDADVCGGDDSGHADGVVRLWIADRCSHAVERWVERGSGETTEKAPVYGPARMLPSQHGGDHAAW